MINERSIRGRNHHTFTSLLPGLLLTTYYHFSLPLILDFLHIKKKKKDEMTDTLVQKNSS